MLLDDAIGYGFSIVSWGIDPARLFTEEQKRQFEKLGVRLFCAVSPTQTAWTQEHTAETGTEVLSDVDGKLKAWYDVHCVGTVFIRPDRFVAATCLNGEASRGWDALITAASLNA